MKKGDILEGKIEEYDFPNKGSLFASERKVTIKGALPGQTVSYRVKKKKAGMAEGTVLEVLERAPIEDVTPTCPYVDNCGGCSYTTLSYQNQLQLKEQVVKKLLDKLLLAEGSNSADYVWDGILGSPVDTAYRNKMEYTFGDAYKNGPLALGLHKKGGFYDILQVSKCEIVGILWGKILDYTSDFFAERKVPFYHRMKHEGILRSLVVRQSRATKEFLVNLVTSTQWETFGFGDSYREILREYAEGLVALFEASAGEGSLAGVLYTENDTLGDVVKCDRMEILYGKDFITEEVMGLTFKISPFSFFQTNTGGCEVLYAKAREYILSGTSLSNEADKAKVIYDLYSGTGTIAQMMAPVAKHVIGIEIVEEAVSAAKENAAINGLTNCSFIAGDVLKTLDDVEEKPDLIIVDPPRDGIHPKALEKILSYGVDEIVYISCKPTSLVRDLAVMTSRGYRVVKACAVDQFPRTVHVETVCLLSQRKPDTTIEVDLDISELEVSSAETKATYEEIKSYVLKKFGLKVSNLYIAQVKRECGIVERINYNLPKTEGNRVPQCPEDKRKAIKDAFIHFQMI